MQAPQRVVIHIGAPKTGSTSFQRGVLGGAPSVVHFGEVGDGTTLPAEESVFRTIFDTDDSFYPKFEVTELVNRRIRDSDCSTLVFSSADVLHSNNPSRAASRLRELFGEEASVILVIRNQVDALLSYYAGHGAWLSPAPRPFFHRFVGLQEWLEFQWLLLSSSRLWTFSYWQQIQPFLLMFGARNVKLFTFEDLVAGDVGSWNSLGEVLGIDGNSAMQRFVVRRDRARPKAIDFWVGRVTRTLPLFFGRLGLRPSTPRTFGPEFRPQMPASEILKIVNFYQTGNRKLQEVFGVDLKRHNYPGL